MRIRTVKPGFWHDEELASISVEAQLLAVGLLNLADDEGYFRFIPKLIESTLFPLRELSLSIHGMLSELSKIGFISVKKGLDGKEYGHVSNFLKNQRVNRPSPSEIAPLVKDCGDSLNVHGKLNEPSPLEGKGKEGNKEGKGKEAAAAAIAAAPPSSIISKIVQAYPKQSHFRESHEAVAAAIERTAKRGGVSDTEAAEQILAGTAAIAGKLREWSIAERNRFAPTPPNFFNGDRWADDPTTFESRQGSKTNTEEGEEMPLNLGGRKARGVVDLRQA